MLSEKAKKLFKIDAPFAITMWDFSWLERRWPGGRNTAGDAPGGDPEAAGRKDLRGRSALEMRN